MQNATKKLIASLGVVLMGIGTAGAANAATRNIMVQTYKGDGSFRVFVDNGRFGPCRTVNAPVWMNGQISGTVGKSAAVFFYKDKRCSSTQVKNTPLIKITAKEKVNFWLNYRH